MNRLTKTFVGTGMSLVLLGCLFVSGVNAQGFTANSTGLNDSAQKAGYNVSLSCVGKPGGCIASFAGAAINALTGLFGAVFLGLILYGGFRYLLSQGDKDAVKKAKETIVNAIVGLLIVVVSYSIADFVLTAMTSITSATTTATTEDAANNPVVSP